MFNTHHENNLMVTIQDDCCSPDYQIGSIVAGPILEMSDIKPIINKVWIVQAKDHKPMVRYIRYGNSPNRYDLVATNLATNNQLVISDCEIERIAEITWHRILNPQ